MRPITWNDAHGVQFVIDVPLPRTVRHDLRVQAERFLDRYRQHSGVGQLIVHVKRDGPQIACHAHLFAGTESYHGFETGWDVRRVIDGTFDAIDAQERRVRERHAWARA